MRNKPIIKDYKKYAAKDFKKKRFKKKQISKLRQEYERLCKKHHILGQHITTTGLISDKELLVCQIGMVYSTLEIMEKSRRGEIWTIGSDGEGYYPKDQPGFVPK